MRKLTGFKISRSGPVDRYVFEWQNKNEAGAIETYTYQGVEPPRPQLLEKAKRAAKLAAKMVSLAVTESEVEDSGVFKSISFEYPTDNDKYKMRIKASVSIQFGYTFDFTTPNWNVWYSNSRGEFNNNVRGTVHELLQECWKYIDGERAQTKLNFNMAEDKEQEDD